MTSLVDLLADLEIDDSTFREIRRARVDEGKFREVMKDRRNEVVLAESIVYFMDMDPEKEEKPREFRAFLNLLHLLLIEFSRSRYFRSRIGWLMWFWVCYARKDSYFPMQWLFSFDPLNWYRHDEPERPSELEKTSEEDPFNIKGECFVHPEWYQGKSEDKEVVDSSDGEEK